MTLGLLHVMEDAARVRVADDATEVGGSIIANTGAQNDSLGILVVEELGHLVQREGAADVGVEDEDALGAALEDGIAEVVEAASGAEGLVLSKVLDGQVGELVAGILDEVSEDRLVVVTDHDNLLDGRDLGDRREAVPDDGVTCDIEEGLFLRRCLDLDDDEGMGYTGSSMRVTNLRDVEGERSESSASGGTSDLKIE